MTARIYVVRHARAGDRKRWTEADRLRPLTPLGERQARALVRPLRRAGVLRLLSSSSVRCLDTLRPFGESAGLPVERSDALAEGASRRALRTLLRGLRAGTAICTHGNLIADLLEDAFANGAPLPARLRIAKASIWIIEVGPDGRVERARYRPPPTPD